MFLTDKELIKHEWTHFGFEHNSVVLYADGKKSAPNVNIMSDRLTDAEKTYVYSSIKAVCTAHQQLANYHSLKAFFEKALPQTGHHLKYDKPVSTHYVAVGDLHDFRIKEVVRANGGFVMSDGKKDVGIEHLTANSEAKLLKESIAQCARDAIYARVTGPSNHFIDEERRFLYIATEGMTADEKKEAFRGFVSDLETRFYREQVHPGWIEDVQEELDDLAQGKVRGDIISQGM